ncbi:MAG: alpha-ketoglutarate-dependent dioxygenase AlkB family protein [Ilumatobacteraceae bacterium]
MDTRPPTRTSRVSRRGGVPTVLRDEEPAGQLALDLVADRDAAQRHELLPGVVHIAGWLDADEQRSLVADFRAWAAPPAGLRHPRVPAGHVMTVESVCLGWHWYPYAYSRTADDTDGAPVKPMPDHIVALARRAVEEAEGPGAADGFQPDAAIVNLYSPEAHLGLHQDGDEPVDEPVVTISLGDACVFRMAGVDRRTGPFTDVRLDSGDLLVFGGPNRLIFHGVTKVLAGTAPPSIGLPPGRLSITVRQTGLS